MMRAFHVKFVAAPRESAEAFGKLPTAFSQTRLQLKKRARMLAGNQADFKGIILYSSGCSFSIEPAHADPVPDFPF
jgi:hypothetical protein